jgi:hypothetical protein
MCDLPAGADRTWLGPYSTARDRIVLGSKRSSVRRKQQAAAAGKSSRSGSHIKFYPGWNCDGHMVSHQYYMRSHQPAASQPPPPRPRQHQRCQGAGLGLPRQAAAAGLAPP